MKNIFGIFVIIIISWISFASCDPIENREKMKGSVTEAEVRAKVTVEAVVKEGKKSNYIYLSSDGLANCVTSFTHGLGTYVGTNDTVQGFVVSGTFDVMVNVLNADGTMLPPIPFPVTVEQCFNVAPQWAIFCGSGEKVWSWDETVSQVWGNGGYRDNVRPSWWGVAISGMDGQMAGNGAGATMTFAASGAKLIKTKSDGAKEQGTFSFDMSKTKMNAGGDAQWAIGKLYTSSVTVLSGKAQNKGGGPVYDYDILKLNDSELVLAWPEDGDGAGSWSGCWFWMFRAK